MSDPETDPVSDPVVDMEPFDLLGPLPSGTTLLEASAGTGKTYAVAALVTRYVAEGHARLDELLVVTFGRAASQELRARVREQLVEAEVVLADPAVARARGGLLGLLARAADEEVVLRRERLRTALADFDAATIATTHQFCQLVLRSLGVAGDTDTGAELVDDLSELVEEVVDDLYLRTWGGTADRPPLRRDEALALARVVVGDPQAALGPTDAEPGSRAETRVRLAGAVRHELDRRKRRLGLLSYDDLLSRLAAALEPVDSPARERMRQRWRIVLVDEFQDTDPVQWAVLDRAFTGHATMVLIGDPKQAIYAFRGGDVFSYLDAAETAGIRRTLAVNHRSDAPLVDALQALLGGAHLGDPRIAVHPVRARAGGRLAGAPTTAPVRLRQLRRDGQGPTLGANKDGTVPIGAVRGRIAEDLAADVAALLSSDATFDGRPLQAGDVAVLMDSLRQVGAFQEALRRRGIPSVVGGSSNVLLTEAADEWLTLLEALEQPHRSGRVRAVALGPFVALSVRELDARGDEATDDVAERVRRWLDLARARGIAAVHEAVVADGLAERVLTRPGGERLLTDLDHLGQVLHEVAHRERLGVPGLLEWLRSERRAAGESSERTRRLDTDAHAVQFTTIHASKGLQYPVVYLPLLFNKWRPEERTPLFHDEGGRRSRDVGGVKGGPAWAAAERERCGEELRLTYVALTRAQSQVVAWWAPTSDACHSGFSRLLFGRGAGVAAVPDRLARVAEDDEATTVLGAWQQAGALVLETVGSVVPPSRVATPSAPALGIRRFDRGVDTAWRRTSYSGLIRVEEQVSSLGVGSEPEVEGTVDEDTPPVAGAEEQDAVLDLPDVPSPMADLPGGAGFGSLVHAVLEHTDPRAPDLAAELTRWVEEERRWWAVEATTEELVAGLLPLQHTSLGPLADGRTLAQIGLGDRLCELDFEFPLVGGEEFSGVDVPLADVAELLRLHLPADDPVRPYADRLANPSLGGQLLRGYLSGSIDVVLRVGSGAQSRYVVVDYKTNRLGTPGEPLTALDYSPAAVTEAMLHSHYPLQALLYSVVLHRYLRWRLGSTEAGYHPERHLGGVLYLYVRGMCGPQTPLVDGQPCGVFSWQPPAALVVALSDLLDGRRPLVDAGEMIR